MEDVECVADILIVEDSPTQAELLQHLLERRRYRVGAAKDGAHALERIGECIPSLVISDIVMPEMDGYELCRNIKSDARTRRIPVILLTSLTDAEDVLLGLDCGADGYITKPYSESNLLASVERILASRKLCEDKRERITIETLVAGKRRLITVDPQQMFSLLLSSYEAAVNRNGELTKVRDELESLNEHLEELVKERTAKLSDEIAERERAQGALRES
jgi:DNA-binding response OmpR family regulator